jgi:hypothetical protein
VYVIYSSKIFDISLTTQHYHSEELSSIGIAVRENLKSNTDFLHHFTFYYRNHRISKMRYISVFREKSHEETPILLGVPLGLLAYHGYIVVYAKK